MKALGCLVLMLGLWQAAALLLIPCLLGFFFLKKHISRMDSDHWEAYFRRISGCGYLIRFLLLSLLPMALVSVAGYWLFQTFGFANPLILSILTFFLGIARTLIKLFVARRSSSKKFRGFSKSRPPQAIIELGIFSVQRLLAGKRLHKCLS